jgi:hypothetical protein
MRCEDFESRLNEVLDNRSPLSSAPDVEDHVRQCGECRELARSYEAVLLGLRQGTPQGEPSWPSRQIVRQSRGPRVLRFTDRRPAVFALAIAASLLLVLGLSWTATHHERPNATGGAGKLVHNPPLKHVTPPPNTPAAGAHQPTVARLPSTDAGSIPPPSNVDGLMLSLPGTDWAQDLADGLQPVTQPTVGAISGFLNLWGVGDEGHRS